MAFCLRYKPLIQIMLILISDSFYSLVTLFVPPNLLKAIYTCYFLLSFLLPLPSQFNIAKIWQQLTIYVLFVQWLPSTIKLSANNNQQQKIYWQKNTDTKHWFG